MVTTILSIVVGILIFVGISLISITNILWDILQELKKIVMVTLYLTGTSIRLESKIAVGEHMLQKYREFKEKVPKEFCINRTRKGCFAYLNQHYSGKDVVEQANKLDDDNGNIVESLSTMKTEDEKNLDTCMKVLRGRGYNLLADWVYKKLAPMQIQDAEFEDDETPI